MNNNYTIGEPLRHPATGACVKINNLSRLQTDGLIGVSSGEQSPPSFWFPERCAQRWASLKPKAKPIARAKVSIIVRAKPTLG